MKFSGGFIVIVVLLVIFAAYGVMHRPPDTKTEPVKQMTPAELRQWRIEQQFDTVYGYHIESVSAIKATMHNPASFKHVGTRAWDRGEYLEVETTFRGTNAFGAIVTETVTRKFQF
jgi:hypothetical protein